MTERPADRIVALYERHAAAWDRARCGGPFAERAWLDRFLALLPAGASVLDLGCGGGAPIGRYLIDRGIIVTGVDSSPSLIAICRERLPGGTWLVGDMRALSLGRTFDGIVAWDSFFHLSAADQRRVLPRLRGHLGPGGALLFTSGDRHEEAIGAFEGEPLYHASLDPAEYRSLLADHGLRVVAHIAGDPDCGDHTVWLAAVDDDVTGSRSAPSPGHTD